MKLTIVLDYEESISHIRLIISFHMASQITVLNYYLNNNVKVVIATCIFVFQGLVLFQRVFY
ncbi:hypothetical protein J22TS1_12760 [Siminovitchia terrae]|nr:hypothetical protein J22TS1_12760 [Siminovitchia terrae]